MAQKYQFYNDYSEGAHPRILEKLLETNLQQTAGYGEDPFCREAAELIQTRMERRDAAVHFLSGGTQANQVVLASLLRPFESVIAPHSGHIAVHEAGAIEVTGHKINTVASDDGKLLPAQIEAVCDEHTDEHMVRPRVVFVSDSTEVGTAYCKAELEGIAETCRRRGLYLYLDGARLGSGLTSSQSDLRLADLARLVDAFYIGGTKNGALIGEAVVLCNPAIQADFRFHMKQRGGLLAKGRVMGVQFLELFRDDLYFDLARHANAAANRLAGGISAQGYGFLSASSTNQIFPIFPNSVINRMQESYGFYVWKKMDANHSAVRLVTSWATRIEAVEEFLQDLKASTAR